jgi:hypothetical protein
VTLSKLETPSVFVVDFPIQSCVVLHTGVCYNERMLQQTFLSIKSGCYNELGGILFIVESSILVSTRERLFIVFTCVRLFMLFVRESLFIVFTEERLFILFVRESLFIVFTKERILCCLLGKVCS